LQELNISFDEVAFAGNELLDIKLAERVGLAIAVPSSVRELLDVADYVTRHDGGHGAVREIIECYFQASGKDPKAYIR
ncbi:MAG TPA: HAD hydrolase family protein, partial [Candidatus Acidoferrum sp.]|nr:HAD hydrolase family protein [Candidatus Acidoferrum sp.]